MQSSLMKAAKLRLNAASHSGGLSFSGELGTWPAVASRSVAVDNAEAAELRFRLAFPATPEDQPCRGPDATRKQEAHSECPDRHHRKVGAHLGADVGRLADLLAKGLGGSGKLLAF